MCEDYPCCKRSAMAARWGDSDVTDKQTNKQTDRQTDYYNPLAAARPRVNYALCTHSRPTVQCRGTIRDTEILCSTSAGELGSTTVVVAIDNARISNPAVFFNYLNNPNVTAVFPSNTIPSGGVTLTFTGVGLNVAQQPVLQVDTSSGATLVNCTVMDSTTVTCVTPDLRTTSLSPVSYSLLFDNAPPTTQHQLPLNVQPDPANFRLGNGTGMVPTGTPTIIRILVRCVCVCVYTVLILFKATPSVGTPSFIMPIIITTK